MRRKSKKNFVPSLSVYVICHLTSISIMSQRTQKCAVEIKFSSTEFHERILIYDSAYCRWSTLTFSYRLFSLFLVDWETEMSRHKFAFRLFLKRVMSLYLFGHWRSISRYNCQQFLISCINLSVVCRIFLGFGRRKGRFELS